LTSKLLAKYKQKIEGLELQPSDGGCFELTLDGKLVYSKLQTGSFPDEDQLVGEVGKRLR
jgi:selenoprotein W-related protein